MPQRRSRYKTTSRGPAPQGTTVPKRRRRQKQQVQPGYMQPQKRQRTGPKRKLSDAHRKRLQKGAHRYRQRQKWGKRGRVGRFIGRTFYRPLKRQRKTGGLGRRGKRLSVQHRKKISEGVKRAHKMGKFKGQKMGRRKQAGDPRGWSPYNYVNQQNPNRARGTGPRRKNRGPIGDANTYWKRRGQGPAPATSPRKPTGPAPRRGAQLRSLDPSKYKRVGPAAPSGHKRPPGDGAGRRKRADIWNFS